MIKRIEAHFRELTRATVAAAREHGVEGAAMIEEGGSHGMFCGPESVLTQASGSFAPAEVEVIDRFFVERGTGWEAIVTPHADPGALDALIALGGRAIGWENLLARKVEAMERPTDAVIVQVDGDLAHLWAEVSATAFHGDAITDQHRIPNRIGSLTANTRLYLAYVDGVPAGAGAVSVFERVAFLGFMATFAEYRGRGIQSAMIARRLTDVVGEADYAILGATPSGPSERNAQRLGFSVVYSSLSLRMPNSTRRDR